MKELPSSLARGLLPRFHSILPVLALALVCTTPVLAGQETVEHAMDREGGGMDLSYWFGILELPFLFITIFFAFRTAGALRGGVFGRGMGLMAWGFLVMAVGHLHMQAKHLFGFDLFTNVFGHKGGTIVWFVALVLTWVLSGSGLYSMFKASRSA